MLPAAPEPSTAERRGEVLVVIPARGGSKGIPRKNLVVLGGRPLVARAVEAALGATCAPRVVVSTDDREIAQAAGAAGAEVVERPESLAGCTASSEAAVQHVIDTISVTGPLPSITVMLQCTSPLIEPADIDGAVALIDRGYDSAFTACLDHGFLWQSAEGAAVGVNHDPAVRSRRQDRPAQYRETGAVYAMCTDGFLASGHRFFGAVGMVEVPPLRSIEIDDPDDVPLARAAVEVQRGRTARSLLPATVGAVVLDFDGVLTDNKVQIAESGREQVSCDRGDGMGLAALRATGLPILVLSTERNRVVAARCRKLGLECHQGIDDKAAVLSQWLAERSVPLAEAIYVGNDVNDLGCMRMVGGPVAVADAVPPVKDHAVVVLDRRGGDGAVRELCDLLLTPQGARP